MKRLATIFFVAFTGIASGQIPNSVDKLILCYRTFNVPEGCTAEIESELNCKDYSVQWIYMNEETVNTMPEQYVKELESRTKNFKEDTLSLYILKTKMNAYKVTHKADDGTKYEFVAYGIANEQPVIVHLTLNHDITKNEDIPEFPRQFFKITN